MDCKFNKLDKILSYLPAGLLLGFILYLPFVKELQLAHALVAIALAGAHMFQSHLVRQDTFDVEKELAALKVELEASLSNDRESLMKRFERMEDEVSKVALAASRIPSSSSKRVDSTPFNF